MDPVRVEALGMAALFGLGLAALSAVMIGNWSRAARGELARNPHLGVRTPSTLRSAQAWVVGNRAAVRTAPLYLLFNLAMCAVLVAVALQGWRLVVVLVGSGGLVVFLALSICTAVVAGRAARAVDSLGGERGAASQYHEILAVVGPRPERAPALSGWIVALIACATAVLMLAMLVDGYVLAIHHQLPPNGTFGFRDATTRSCLPAWYAAQKAGFGWSLFGYGPLAVLSVLAAVEAAIKRRAPRGVAAVVMATLFLLIVVVIVAGVHADSVARAVTC